MFFFLGLLIVATVNVGLALNWANRKADRALRVSEFNAGLYERSREYEMKRAVFNADHAFRVNTTDCIGPSVTMSEGQRAVLANGI